MDLTENKAKHILDFLAQRLGYEGFSLSRGWGMCEIPKHKMYDGDCRYDRLCLNHYEPYFMKRKTKTYVQALDTMFEMSRYGKDIWCGIPAMVYLPAHSSLEQVMIHMDLEEISTSKT